MEVCDCQSSVNHVAMATGVFLRGPTLGERLSILFWSVLELVNADMMCSSRAGCGDSFALDAIRIGRILPPGRPVVVAILPVGRRTATAAAGERFY